MSKSNEVKLPRLSDVLALDVLLAIKAVRQWARELNTDNVSMRAAASGNIESILDELEAKLTPIKKVKRTVKG